MVYTNSGAFGTRTDELMKQLPIQYIQHLINLPGDALVRVYSYQGPEAWALAEQQGYWSGTVEATNDETEAYLPAYEWMRDQMAIRIDKFSGDLPMWAWLKRPSTKNKPTRYRGTSGLIRLTALVPRSRILISDFDTWHSVLRPRYLALTEAEYDEHSLLWRDRWVDDNFNLTPEYLEAIRPSWQRCLEIRPPASSAELAFTGSPKHFRVQACIDRFYWNEIVHVRRFNQDRYKRE